MKKKERYTIVDLRAALAREGLGYHSFARKEGFKPQTVVVVVQRYWGKEGKPRGRVTRAILARLTDYCKGTVRASPVS